MHSNTRDANVRFFHPRIVDAVSRHCCPACGHIVGGRMKWDYPPIRETLPVDGFEGKSLFSGEVLAFCPVCQSWFVQTEVLGSDREAIENYIAGARPAQT